MRMCQDEIWVIFANVRVNGGNVQIRERDFGKLETVPESKDSPLRKKTKVAAIAAAVVLLSAVVLYEHWPGVR